MLLFSLQSRKSVCLFFFFLKTIHADTTHCLSFTELRIPTTNSIPEHVSDAVCCCLPASSPPSRSLRRLLRWRAETPARRKPARTPPPTTQAQTSEPPSSPKGAQTKSGCRRSRKKKLQRFRRIQQPDNFKPPQKMRLLFCTLRGGPEWACPCAFIKSPCSLLPTSSNLILKWIYPAGQIFFPLVWLRRDVRRQWINFSLSKANWPLPKLWRMDVLIRLFLSGILPFVHVIDWWAH